jgi:hypothetical protein
MNPFSGADNVTVIDLSYNLRYLGRKHDRRPAATQLLFL